MFKSFILIVGILFFLNNSEKVESWAIDNLYEIGGHSVTVFGNPEVVETMF